MHFVAGQALLGGDWPVYNVVVHRLVTRDAGVAVDLFDGECVLGRVGELVAVQTVAIFDGFVKDRPIDNARMAVLGGADARWCDWLS